MQKELNQTISKMKITINRNTEIIIKDKDGKVIERFIPEQISEQKGSFGHTIAFTKSN